MPAASGFRTILSLAAHYNTFTDHVDISEAFLQAELLPGDYTTIGAFLAKEGCAIVGFETSMWTVMIDGARILLGAHIDDFVIACTNWQVLDGFCARLLDAFEGTYERALQRYLGVR